MRSTKKRYVRGVNFRFLVRKIMLACNPSSMLDQKYEHPGKIV